MKMTEWRYRFFEEDGDTEDLDITDDICSNDDKSADIDISNDQIQELVKSEIQRQMNSSSLDIFADTSIDTPDTEADEQQKGADEHSLYQQRMEQKKNKQQLPHHKVPSQSDFHLPKKAHKHKRRKRHINHPMAKDPSRPHYNVVYEELERVNIYPANTEKLIPFNHFIKGNYILFSSVLGTDTADTNMKRVHSLITSLFNFKHQFLPIYTYNSFKDLIDITFAIFPRDDTDKGFDILEASVKAIIKRQQIGSYVEFFNGFHTLITESQIVHYAFGDLDKVLDNYTKERGISTLFGSRHFLNPYPQTRRECLYRSKVGEIWKGRIQVKSV